MKPLYCQRIAARRKTLRWTRARLADQLQLVGLDVSASWVNNVERGDRGIGPQDILCLALALGVDPNWLLGWDKFKQH